MEWGHFIEETPNLLLVNGSIVVQSSAFISTQIDFTLTMDGATITSRSQNMQPADEFFPLESVAFGAQLQDVPVDHHVFRLFAFANTEGVFAGDRDSSSFSGPASNGLL